MSKLNQVVTGQQVGALKYLFYGVGGVGKSTLAAAAPSPIFLDVNHGTNLLHCARYPLSSAPKLEELNEALDDLISSKHDFWTVVIDTIGEVEQMIWKHIIKRDSARAGKNWTNIEEYGGGYHKGYTVAVDGWREFLTKLNALLARGMNVILLAHSVLGKRKSALGLDWDQTQPAVHHMAGTLLAGWADVVGFAEHEEGSTKLEKQSRPKGYTSGNRVMHFDASPSHIAKSRLDLHAKLVMSRDDPWAPFLAATTAAVVAAASTRVVEPAIPPEINGVLVAATAAASTPKMLRSAIAELLQNVQDPELVAKVEAFVNVNPNNREQLETGLRTLKNKIASQA